MNQHSDKIKNPGEVERTAYALERRRLENELAQLEARVREIKEQLRVLNLEKR